MSLRRIILATVHCSHITSDFIHTIATDLFLLPGGGKKKKKTLRRPTVSRSDIFILELSLIGLTFSGNPELPTGFEGCRSHDVRNLRVNKGANGRRKGLRVRVREVEAKSVGFGELGREGRGCWRPERAWMPSTAAGRHFSGICQLSSDWPDTANPPRCSALTDECVTVLCEGKSRGRGRGRSGEVVWGRRGRRVPGWTRGLSGTTVPGICGDLGDRMIPHPGIRWHRADCVNSLGARRLTWHPPFNCPSSFFFVQMFVWSCKEIWGSGYGCINTGKNVLKTPISSHGKTLSCSTWRIIIKKEALYRHRRWCREKFNTQYLDRCWLIIAVHLADCESFAQSSYVRASLCYCVVEAKAGTIPFHLWPSVASQQCSVLSSEWVGSLFVHFAACYAAVSRKKLNIFGYFSTRERERKKKRRWWLMGNIIVCCNLDSLIPAEPMSLRWNPAGIE